MSAKRILMIEDEPDFRFGVRMQLEASGYEVTEAEDGAKGLEAARVEKPDLILLDLTLPEMNGYEVARMLRKDETDGRTPIIMLTAHSQQSDRDTGTAAGVDAYLIKPFNPAELLETITGLLDK